MPDIAEAYGVRGRAGPDSGAETLEGRGHLPGRGVIDLPEVSGGIGGQLGS